MAVGGSEKWPIQFYPALFDDANSREERDGIGYKGQNGGFVGPDVVKAWKMYKELCELEPFQDSFRTTNTREAVGFFHDGKAAFHLQAGAWVLGVGGTYAADKEGLPDAKLGFGPAAAISSGSHALEEARVTISALPTSVAAPTRPVVARLVVARLVVVPGPMILAVKVRMPRGGTVAGAAVGPLAVIGTLAVVRLTVISTLAIVRLRLLIALVEVVKQKRERERDAKADLRLSRVLGRDEQTACREQNEKRLHAWNLSVGRNFASDFCR
jgi:hypothetical protein